MLQWHIVTSSTYYTALTSSPASIKDDSLYFLSDTGEIMKGSTPYNRAVEFLTSTSVDGDNNPVYTYPDTPARKRIYINPATLEGKVYDGSNWTTVIKPVDTMVSDTGTNPVTGSAIASYVSANAVSSIGYTSDTATLNFTKNGTNTGTDRTIVLEGLGVKLATQTDGSTGQTQIVLKDINDNQLGDPISLDLDRFVKAANYDSTNKKIILAFDNSNMELATDKIEIEVADLVDTYTVGNTDTINLTMDSNDNNKITATLNISSNTDNKLVYNNKEGEKGLYVAPTDTSGLMSKISGVTTGTVNNLVKISNTDGDVADAGVNVGGAQLAETPTSTTLATEVAVSSAVNTKMSKLTASEANQVVVVGSQGDSYASGKTVGGANFAATGNDNILATEGGVINYISNSTTLLTTDDVASTISATSTADDDKIATVGAIKEALAWKTTL